MESRRFTSSWNRTKILGVGLITAVLLLPACQPTEAPNSDPGGVDTSQTDDRVPAATILTNMRKAYEDATAYQDQAVLALSYQLQGSYLEEPHQWAVDFQRENQLIGRIYNVRVRSDGRQMGCFIYDFSSGNLDNQWQIHTVENQLPLERLLQDPICHHYITGQTDLPINDSIAGVAEMFFPPTIGLLTGQSLGLEWLLSGTATRLPDRPIDSRKCHGIQIEYSGLTTDVWIDADTWLLREIHYPVTAPDRRLHDNPAVKNLKIIATFTGANTSPSLDDSHFVLETPKDAVPVEKFVAVPEPFPSASIGKTVPAMGFLDRTGFVVNQKDWSGKVTLLAWSGVTPMDHSWRTVIDQVASNLPAREYVVAEIRTIPDLVPGDPRLSDQLENIPDTGRTTIYVDPGFSSGQMIGLNSWPVYAILDRQGMLQFVDAIDDQIPDSQQILNVMQRIRSGDDVAAEMRSEYENFLDLYYQRLQAARLDRDDQAPFGRIE